MTAPRAREQRRPSPPSDLLPPRRGGRSSPCTYAVSAAGRPAGFVRLRSGRRELVHSVRTLAAAALLALSGALALPAQAQDGASEPSIVEVYAPRAALYEALPGFLLRLEEPGSTAAGLRLPGSPVWALLSGGRGSYAPGRSSVGAEYDFEHLTGEAGLSEAFGESLTGSISMRYVRGSAEVSSPAGGGELEARGFGMALGASWNSEGGYYVTGRASLTYYGVDVLSGKRGLLKKDAGVLAHSLGFEAGRRLGLNEWASLTPRLWLNRSALSMDEFTDAVDSRVSSPEADRFTGGLGVGAQTARSREDGALSLRGSLDLAQALGGAGTIVEVSGTELSSESAKTRVLLGLGVAYRKGRFSLGAGFSAHGLGTDDTHYSGQIHSAVSF